MKKIIGTKPGRRPIAKPTLETPAKPPAKSKVSDFKSILVPIDFSETSIRALDYALALAREFHSQLHLVHVLEFPAVFNTTSQPSYALWDKEAKKSAATRLAELITEKVGKSIPVNSEVRFGRAFRTICNAAKEHSADLIVIGTHGFTGLKHLLLGSTAERVVRHAPCSVLTVHSSERRNATAMLKLRKILVPTDFSKAADATLQSALSLAKLYQAKLHLLYVVPVHHGYGDYAQIEFRSLEAEQRETAKEQLAGLSKSLVAQSVPIKTEIRTGRPATEIVQVAEELDSDLIAISTHGRTGWEHALLGSTTEEVIRHSTCPVLVMRPKENARPKQSRKT